MLRAAEEHLAYMRFLAERDGPSKAQRVRIRMAEIGLRQAHEAVEMAKPEGHRE